MPADVGVQLGARGGGGGGGAVCDQGAIGEGNRQRCRREAAAGEAQTAAGGAEGVRSSAAPERATTGSAVDSEKQTF